MPISSISGSPRPSLARRTLSLMHHEELGISRQFSVRGLAHYKKASRARQVSHRIPAHPSRGFRAPGVQTAPAFMHKTLVTAGGSINHFS